MTHAQHTFPLSRIRPISISPTPDLPGLTASRRLAPRRNHAFIPKITSSAAILAAFQPQEPFGQGRRVTPTSFFTTGIDWHSRDSPGRAMAVPDAQTVFYPRWSLIAAEHVRYDDGGWSKFSIHAGTVEISQFRWVQTYKIRIRSYRFFILNTDIYIYICTYLYIYQL
ncbi:uncharacterized protein BP01DRAFT_225317 [Aspergillus saccharolyticus JOP 1030-1]|uniref:Uncharacterized protein n=1 Tax=Aspergillus saccharolyticus JOP 1030-1 TaxID=1450539 RepID=A0A318YYY6_9EURO|nr:hypothetical protein BP01DRAFT_225317 [Aspergillus saccharolyticus JOP 1030-1]PYH40221.1 hypothetical protein BP01DRAFT_225317 [Aspergillus saccharolyticus JOP 1030-1]